MSTTKIHTLKSLLRVASPDHTRYYFLPQGTTLYYDDSLPEGLDRFYIYVNVEGINLPLQEIPKPNFIAPISAYPIEGEEIIDLLERYPISKDDLEGILKSQSPDKEDLQNLIHRLQKYVNSLP
jgi:hypothetical protein